MAIELGVAYLSILGETSKLSPGITKAMSAAARPAGKAFSAGLDTSLGAVAKKFGTTGKGAGEALAKSALSAAKADIGKLSNSLTTALGAQSSAADRLRIAQLRLSEVQGQAKPKASTLATAQLGVSEAQRKVAATNAAAKGATEKLAGAQLKAKTAADDVASAQRRAATAASGSGTQTGNRFTRAFKSAFKPDASAGLDKVDGTREGSALGRRFSAGFKRSLASAVAVMGIGKLITDSVGIEMAFSQTMNTMGAVAKVPQDQIKTLSALAIKMGADTTFSASEAAGAMLELAKGGLSAATIKGGALQGTLTLAAAGGIELADASTIASNALNTFSLKGSDMASVAAALAGGANASSASVQSLGEALGQVGPGATNAGLSLQDTVGTLSAFDAAGIKGSDAGTSLKTMLSRLVPSTKEASKEMRLMGLKFVDAQDSFLPITDVAQQLKDKLGGLSEASRSAALTTLFGSDATRAATVLMKQGSAGLGKYIAATKDQGAADKVAAARMAGTAGAWETFKGSVETAKLQLGLFIAPAVQAGLKKLTEFINGLVPGIKAVVGFLKENKTAVTAVASVLAGLVILVQAHAAALAFANLQMKIQAAGGMLKWLVQLAKGTRIVTAAQWAWNVAVNANVFSLIVIAIIALVVIIAVLWKKNEGFRKFILAAWAKIKDAAVAVFGAIKAAVSTAIDFVKNHWKLILGIIGGPLVAIVLVVATCWAKIKAAFATAIAAVLSVLSVAWGAIVSVVSGPLNLIIGIIRAVWSVVSIILALPVNIAVTLITAAWSKITAAFTAGKDWVIGVFSAAWNLVSGVLAKPINAAKAWLDLKWAQIRLGFTVVKDWVLNVFGKAWATVKGKLTGPINSAKAAIDTTWANFKRGFGVVKDWVLNVFGKAWNAVTAKLTGPLVAARDFIGRILGAGKNGLQSIFNGAVDAVGKIWDKLQDLVKKPIRFIIKTVLNEGLIAGFNSIAHKFHSPELTPIPMPAGLERGGRIPGRASSTDNMIAMSPYGPMGVASGEYLVNARQTAKNLPLLEAINSGTAGAKAPGQPSVNLTVNYPLPEKVSVALPRLLRSAASQLVPA